MYFDVLRSKTYLKAQHAFNNDKYMSTFRICTLKLNSIENLELGFIHSSG